MIPNNSNKVAASVFAKSDPRARRNVQHCSVVARQALSIASWMAGTVRGGGAAAAILLGRFLCVLLFLGRPDSPHSFAGLERFSGLKDPLFFARECSSRILLCHRFSVRHRRHLTRMIPVQYEIHIDTMHSVVSLETNAAFESGENATDLTSQDQHTVSP
jgi:hypothetical protein